MFSISSVPRSEKEKDFHSVEKKLEPRFEGFDFLRAISCIAVVALKTNLFLLIELFTTATLAHLLTAKFAYLAVPVFLQISLFLFYLKSEKEGFSYFLRKRLPRLIYLYAFWVGLKVLFDIFAKGEFWAITKTVSSPRSLIEFIVSGGQSPFFFFFTMIFSTTLAATLIFIFKNFQIDTSRKLLINYGLLLVSCLFVFGISVTEIFVNLRTNSSMSGIARSISNIAFWDYNSLSFLPYLFTASIVAQEFHANKLRNWSSSLKLKLCILLSLSIFFTILEWHLFDKLLHYSRLSLVFGSWSLLYLALVLPLKAPPIIKLISACSLGIYGFHVFFTHYFSVGDIGLLKNLEIPGLKILMDFVVVLTASIALTLIFKKINILKSYV